jgi:hypothetical protein
MLSSIPLAVLEECQRAGYQVLEDMHRLYNHQIVQHSKNRQIEYLQLVNRKNPREGAEPSAIKGSDIHTRFLISDRAGLQRMREEAIALLGAYDESRLLPPPLWLRMLPVCCSIVLDGDLFAERELPIFRWLAFNIDVPGRDKSSALSIGTVNINSNRTKSVIELFTPAQNLSLVLYEYLRSPNKPQSLPYYTSWGIRFRTTRNNESLGYWVDIQADVDNLQSNEGAIPRLVSARTTAPSTPFPQSPNSVAFVRDIISQWAGQTGHEDLAHQATPTRELSAYCQTLQQFYPQGRWPSEGIDCLLCPSLVWSPEPKVLGAAGTIYWGFEGSLTQWQCSALLLLSQILMASTPLYINNPQIKEAARLRGKTDFLHKVPSYVSALINGIENEENKWKEFMKREVGKSPPSFDNKRTVEDMVECLATHIGVAAPSFTMTETGYVAGVCTMFLVADTEHEFKPLPDHAVKLLEGPWNSANLKRFASLFVWPVVRERITKDDRITSKLRTHNVELDGIADVEAAMPDISVVQLNTTPADEDFEVTGTRELYPLLWYALNSALQHGAVNQLINETRGKIRIEYSTDPKQRVIVKNTGEPPTGVPQDGWERDLNIINNLKNPLCWEVTSVDGQYSTYNNDAWITTIERIDI